MNHLSGLISCLAYIVAINVLNSLRPSVGAWPLGIVLFGVPAVLACYFLAPRALVLWRAGPVVAWTRWAAKQDRIHREYQASKGR